MKLIRFLKECFERGKIKEAQTQSKMDRTLSWNGPLLVIYPLVAFVAALLVVPFVIYGLMLVLWSTVAKGIERIRR